MSRIYLDTNVYSNLRSSTSPLYKHLNESLSSCKANLTFIFSPAHIRDKRKDSSDHKFLDFAFIESFAQDNHISYHALEKCPNFYLATPQMVYDDDSDDITLDSVLNQFKVDPNETDEINTSRALLRSILDTPLSLTIKVSEIKSPEHRDFLSKMIPLDKPDATLMDILEKQASFYNELVTQSQSYKDLRKIIDDGINKGKYTLSDDANLDFNESLKDSVLQKTFIEFVKDSTRKNNNDQTEYYDFYLQAYNLLDLLGIKKEKVTKKNAFPNLFNDGLHSYYARYCDFFVTADEILRLKSKALYSLFECGTQVLSAEEFISKLPGIGQTTDDSIFTFFEKISKDIKEAVRTDTHVDEDGREQSVLLTTNTYFNFFDCVFEVKEHGYNHYFLRKRPHHLLSLPNFREQAKILDRCLSVLDIDAEGKGSFDFDSEVKDIRNNSWSGRLWKIGTLIISLKRHEGLQEFCIVISPVGSLADAKK
jgi:hypothetical protein